VEVKRTAPKLVALDAQVDPDVVAALEALIQEARRGRIRGVAVVASGAGDLLTAWAGDVDFPATVAAFEVWKHRFLHAAAGDPLPEAEE
jgi:hypothetical protein